MLKPKDSLQAERKKSLKEIDEYPIVHDPRRISLLLKELRGSFSRLSGQELLYRTQRVVQDHTVYVFPKNNKELNQRITQLSRGEIHQLNALGLADSGNLEKIAPLLTENNREMMLNWAKLGLDKISYFKKENELIRILPKSLFNPLTAWFVDEAYLDLNNSVRFLIENLSDNREIEEKIYLLMLLGHLHGKFSQPECIQYKRFFRQFIHRDSPAILRELVQVQDDERPEFEKKQERLQKLKDYWHAVFVQAWMAKAKLQYDGRKALSHVDQIIGQQDLGMDMRPSDTIKGAESFGMSMEMRLPDREGESRRQAEMHMAEELRMERKARESKWNAQNYMNEVLHLYNVDHTLLSNKESRTEGKWSRFRQKIPLIFDTAVRHGKDLMKKGVSSGDRAEILDTVAIQLRSVIEHDLDCRDLFGVDFYDINSIEQVCLILFTALSLAGEKDKPRLIVQLCSHTLVPHLLDYQISKKKEDLIVERDQVNIDEINWPKYRESALSAFDRLESLPIEDGFCHSDSVRLDTVVHEADEVVDELSNILQLFILKERSRFLTAFGIGLMVFNVPYAFWSGERVANILDANELTTIPMISFLLIGSFMSVLGTYALTRELLSKEVFNRLKKSNFLEIVGELNDIIPEEKRTSKLFQSVLIICFVLMVLAGTSLSIYIDYIYELSNLPQSSIEQSDLPNIPDQISPESISNLPWVYRGDLLSDPAGVDFEATSPLGYQSDGWFNENGLKFTTAGDQSTDGVEVISTQSEVNYTPSQNEIMYSLVNRSLSLIPLDGYRITRLFQVGGKPAERGTAGEFYFDMDHYPESVIIVAEEMHPDENFGNGIVSYAEMHGPEYQPWDGWLDRRNDAITLNSKLSSDLQLQQLHLSLIHEIDSLYARWQDGDLQSQVDQMSLEYSNIGQRYVVLFNQFIQSSRYYSLLFSAKDINGESFLEDIALDQDRAFFCTIASYSFQEFMESVGITVVTKPGNTLYAFEDRLYSRIGHMNAMVVLPNGKILMIDPTPQRPNPGEDLSALELKPITYEDQDSTAEKKLLQKLTYLVVGSSVLGGTAFGLTSLRKEKKRRNRSLEQKIGSHLPSYFQQNVLQASYQILSQLLSFSTKDYQKMLNHFGSEDEFLKAVSHDGVKWLLNSDLELSEDLNLIEIEKMMRKERDHLDDKFQDSGQFRIILMRSIETVIQYLKQRAKEEKDFILSEKERRINDYEQLSNHLERIKVEYDESLSVQQRILFDQTIKDSHRQLTEIEEDLLLIEKHLEILNKTTTSLRRVLNEVLKFLRSN